ncbi:MAG: CocE/NonD family hydrolase [Rhodospirillaceae bacterium]|nr:CocE/NonD family hydrolase [Rhodospirillaceae bacterium]
MVSLSEIGMLRRSAGPIVKRALLSGQLFRPACELVDPHPDILAEYDVRIPLDDGTFVTANVFRSKSAQEAGAKMPAVMCAHPYDNNLLPARKKTPLGGPPKQYRLIPQEGRPRFSTQTSWESPDPNFWVPAGYAVVNMNLPGFAGSGGKPSLFTAEQSEAFARAIDRIGAQDWCTGAVGLNGVSFLAISQYGVAAGDYPYGVPKCLKAICPWEGLSDPYRDMFREGGIEEMGFPVFWWHMEVKETIECSAAEFASIEGQLPQQMAERHPFYDDYWKSKAAQLERIELPVLVCASFSDQGLHTQGSFRVFRQASSAHKWVYTHRRGKWDSYYSPEVQKLTKAFFDCFLKGETDNGFLDTDPVRLEVRSSRDEIHAVRGEKSWPPANTEYRKLFLREGNRLDPAPGDKTEFVCDARTGSLRFSHTFDADTELTGYMKLRLWVETRAKNGREAPPDDMALFVGIDKIDRDGRRVPFYGSVGNREDMVARGLIAVSRRALDLDASTEWAPVLLNERDDRLSPGDIVPVDIAIDPSSTFFSAGEGLRLTVSPNEIVPSPPYRKNNACNRGLHVAHAGGSYDSHLLIPVIPADPEE